MPPNKAQMRTFFQQGRVIAPTGLCLVQFCLFFFNGRKTRTTVESYMKP